MRNLLQPVSWIFALFLLLASSTGIAHAAPVSTESQSAAVSATAPTSPADFGKFAGLWTAHGAFMIISPNGSVHFGARTYNWCGDNVPQPCDSISNDQLRYGYHEQFQLSHATDSVAYGTVVDSNRRPGHLHTAVTLTLGPADTLIYSNSGSLVFLCGPNAPAGTCGA